MKLKKLVPVVTVAALVGVIGITTAFAATSTTVKTEQRVGMIAQKQAMDTKWTALTDAQKAEIYALKEAVDKSETAITDKYLEFGLIDEATSTDMKTRMAERTTQMKANGEMPMMGRGDKGQKGGMGGERAQLTDEQKAQMKADLEARLKQEVADGKITQAKADEILANAANGKMGPLGNRAQLTDEQKAQMKADLEARLKQEVADGKITQAKADEILANAANGKMMRPRGNR